MKKAAIIELGGSHDEVIYSQAAFFRTSGYEVYLYASENLKNRTDTFDQIDHHFYFKVRNHKPAPLRVIAKIWGSIKKNKIDKVVFNTGQGNTVRNFSLLPWGNSDLIGVLHNVDKLDNSINQRIISRSVKKYLVLNEFILNSVPQNYLSRVTHFYPVFFPKYKFLQIDKKDKDIWLCVPGLVEFKRRDYLGLLEALENKKLSPRVKILFLGRIGHAHENKILMEKLQKNGLEDRIILFKGFVDTDSFHSYLVKSDVVMPLLHPTTERFHDYSAVQISGAFNLAYAHRKPLLMENHFSHYSIFKKTSLFYDESELVDKINQLVKDQDIIRDKTREIKDNKNFDFKVQREKYMDFIER